VHAGNAALQTPPSVASCPQLVVIPGMKGAYTGHEAWTGHALGPERRVMTALVNGLLWFATFAIPMTIAVILRRRARKYYAPGDPAQEPDYQRWA
jgi:hypothetical protein